MENINTSNYNLLDSDSNKILGVDDLRCTLEEYDEAIRSSLSCDQAEGHVRIGGVGRRVYAMPV